MKERYRFLAVFTVVSCVFVAGWIFGVSDEASRPGPTTRGHAMADTPELFDSGVPRDVSAQLARYFWDASERLKAIVLHPPGGTQKARDYARANAAKRLEQIDRALRELKAASSQWVGKNVPAAYRAGQELGTRQAIDAGVQIEASGLEGSFSVVDVQAVQRFALDTVGDLHKAADSMGDRAQTVLRQTAQEGLAESEINRILAGGVIDGKPAETIRQLRDELQKVHGDTVEINGRNFDVRYYAEMVARTKTRQATTDARHERLQQMGLDLVSIIGRVSGNFCTAFLGQVFSLSGTSDRYPALSSLPSGGPPFHPNCSKSTRPFVEDLASERQLADAEILPDAEKLLGMKPSAAQRAFKDLQLQSQVKQRYTRTVQSLATG